MADLTLTREQANLIRDEIDDKVSLIETLVMLRGDGMELPTPCTWDEILRAVVAAMEPPPLKVGDRVVYTDEAQTKGTVLRVCDDSPLVYILWDDDLLSRAGDAERPSDLRRVEKEKP